MTSLQKEVTRITQVMHRGGLLVVKMAPEGIYIKRARERWSSAMLVPWTAAYDVGAKLKVRREREEKAARRKERRRA